MDAQERARETARRLGWGDEFEKWEMDELVEQIHNAEQAAREKAKIDDGFGGHPLGNIVYASPCLSDQEIRARALECAVRWLSSRTDALEAVGTTDDEIKTLFWGFAQDFEAYIRDGVM